MTVPERAWQIWPVLVLCASKRILLSYDDLANYIGVPRPGLGQLLEPIQSYCLIKELPALTSLVVGINSGIPGENFIAAENVPAAQAEVYGKDWSNLHPMPEDFKQALEKLPSRNRPLNELRGIINERQINNQ